MKNLTIALLLILTFNVQAQKDEEFHVQFTSFQVINDSEEIEKEFSVNSQFHVTMNKVIVSTPTDIFTMDIAYVINIDNVIHFYSKERHFWAVFLDDNNDIENIIFKSNKDQTIQYAFRTDYVSMPKIFLDKKYE